MFNHGKLITIMRQTRFHATTSLGLCLLAMPLAGFAQTTGGAGDTAMFTPSVRACIATPTEAECADQREVLTQCAIDLDDILCAPLFDAPAGVFQDPARILAAQSMQSGVSTVLAQLDFGVADLDAGGAPDLVIEAIAEDYQIPSDPVRAPDARQRRALERLMADPEVAAALARFGEIRVDDGGDGAGPTVYPQALFALQRAQRGDEPGGEAAEPVEVIEGAVAAADLRHSQDDFAAHPVLEFDAEQVRSDGDSELDRTGLGSLARLAVGIQVNGGLVAARTDERVVIRHADADPALWRDDDAILRDAQSQRWIERFDDGSTLTRWQRADRTWTVSIRDVTGRALWRERIMADGNSVQLISDMDVGEAVELSALPGAVRRELRVSGQTDLDMAMALLQQAEVDMRGLGRTYTLRQVRETRALRELVPVLGPVAISFGVNSAIVNADEVGNLEGVGRLIEHLIANNPRELFLIEGHTDGTGLAVHNLVLSDRRAESVALALTETFAIPPENLIVQGYGKRHLRIPTAEAEAGNRRVEIRRISTLLGQ